VHPAQRGHLVRAIERACGKRSRRRLQRARDRSVAMMQAVRGLEALTERPEDHREDGAEGAMEAANGIGERVRVLFDRGGNPGMGELQQQRAARSQEDRGLPVDLPGDRSRTEYARVNQGCSCFRPDAPPESLLESCRVTPAPSRLGRDSAPRLPLGCAYAQQARVPASGSRRVRRNTQRNAARAQFWLAAEFVALRLKRSFSLCAAPLTDSCKLYGRKKFSQQPTHDR